MSNPMTSLGTLYQSAALAPYAERLIHGFTGKPATFGGTLFAREEILASRRRLCETAGMDFECLIAPDQVHSANSRTNRDGDFRETDAVILLDPEIPAMIQVADCVPVLLYAPDRHIGAVIHAGWRGTAAQITLKTARRLTDEFGSNPEQLIAVIGPAITGGHYEVSPEVADAVMASLHPKTPRDGFYFTNGRGRPHIDLKTVNRLQLASLGVSEIDVLPGCTASDAESFWSYRRGEAGRQVVYLQLRPWPKKTHHLP